MEPITVALPLGIGDSHWSCQKLRSLKEYHNGAPIYAYINESKNHKTIGYLKILKCIDHAFFSKRAPFCITNELPGTYKDPRYSTLSGCKNWNGFDYVLVANHWVEQGKHISKWIPELDTQYELEYEFDDATLYRVAGLMPEPAVLLYLSGIGPNNGFHKNWWTIENWIEIIKLLNHHAILPLIVGANTPDDVGYFAKLASKAKKVTFTSIVGKTTLPEYCLLIKQARAWVGLNSGGGIVSASMGTPTLMFWSDARYRIPGSNANHFDPGMQRSWLSKDQLLTYRTLSYGSPEMTPERAVELILEIIR